MGGRAEDGRRGLLRRVVLVVSLVRSAVGVGIISTGPRDPLRTHGAGASTSPGWLEAQRLTKKNVGASVGLVALGAAVSNRSLRRSARFEWGLAGILRKYAGAWGRTIRSTPAARQGVMEALDEETAEDLLALVRDMRGAYVKSAQLISTAFPEALPAPWVKRLETLTDDAPARPWAATKRIVERELGRPVEVAYASFDPTPIGAASIGQVHRAQLHDGRQVCVKVMYPGVERLIMADLQNVARMLRLFKPALLPAVDEFRDRVRHEFDYRVEAERMDRCRRYLQGGGARRHRAVVVPEPVHAWTTTRLLTMTWLDGRSLKETLQDRHAHILASTHPLRWLTRPLALFFLRRTALRTLRRTADAQGAMIFGDGAFSCDPHPGNVMLLRAHDQVGLIDYGCFANFDDDQRRKIARLYVALERRQEAEIVAAMLAIGFRSERNDPSFIVAFATQCFDRDLAADTRSPYSVLRQLESTDKLIELPKAFMLVARVSLLLRGLGAKCGTRISCAELWRDDAYAVLNEKVQPPSIVVREVVAEVR